MNPITILGAGMAGFGAAHRLYAQGVDSVLYEKNPYFGGHADSHRDLTGFQFDDGLHLASIADERLQRLFAESVLREYETVDARLEHCWRGHRIADPVEYHLYGLPPALVEAILRDLMEVVQAPPRPAASYRERLETTYGSTFAETFPAALSRKRFTVPAEALTAEAAGSDVERPDLERVLRGADPARRPEVPSQAEPPARTVRYPRHSGFRSYLSLFLHQAEYRPGHELVHLDPRRRRLHFADGAAAGYDHLISTLPLHELVARIEGVPAEVTRAAGRLNWTSCVLVNLGVGRTDLAEASWILFYDPELPFYRVSFPHLFSPENAPAGTGSLQAELYFSARHRPLEREPAAWITPVVEDLRRAGILREGDRILHPHAVFLPFAEVIFDAERAPALAVVRGYLEEIGVVTCGRYGEWGLHRADESFASGERAAQAVLDRMTSPAVSVGPVLE